MSEQKRLEADVIVFGRPDPAGDPGAPSAEH
jgi:hypothetical protein